MTTIGIVSDTHLPRFGGELPRALVRGLRAAGVTRILHLGDFTEMLAADLFERIAPFDAVAGNNDGPSIRERFGRKKIVTVEQTRIGMVHGDAGKKPTLENAASAFEDGSVDVVCFGHSHRPHIERRGALLLLNPGSPTDKRMNVRYSYALLHVDGAVADASLHYYLDRSVA